MAIEAERGCGFRKVGGLYLCGGGTSMTCDRFPYELTVCPVCGEGVKFTRGFTWLDWQKYAGNHNSENDRELASDCGCMNRPEWKEYCPVCQPGMFPQPYGLLWVGESYYTPESFIQEAITLGVSKRIAATPKNLKLGETWILFAHKKAIEDPWSTENEGGWKPGIFYAFRPQTLELLVWESEATEEKLAELEKKGITPIIVPDGDIEHDPATKLKVTDEQRKAVMRARTFDDLREIMDSAREG